MFGRILYYDKIRIDEFISVINGEKSISVNEIEQSNEKSGLLNLKIAGADAKVNTKYTARVNESLLLESVEFENKLSGRDDFCDFFSSEYSLDAVGRGVIIKIWGEIFVPEEFDLHQTIKKFKPFLITSMNTDEDFDADSILAMNALISNDDEIKIPVVIEHEGYKLCSMLNSRHLTCSFEELEDLEDEEVTIVARMASSSSVKCSKAYYDPLKDFISLNRVMRRSMDSNRGDGLEPLFLDVDYFKIEIVAIYQ